MAYDKRTELGFDSFIERRIGVDDVTIPDLAESNVPMNDPLPGTGGSSSGILGTIPDSSIPFQKTRLRLFSPNEDMQTTNFVSGSTGWRIKGNGDVEFNNGTFRGALTASTIDIGGSDNTSFHVDIDGNIWLGAATFNISNNPFAVSNAGQIRAIKGEIASWTLSTTTFTSGLTNIVLDASSKSISINNPTFGNDGIQLQYNAGNPRAYIGNGTNYFFNFDGTNISWGAVNTTLSTAGLLTTVSANIGGWLVDSTTIKDNAVLANARIVLDSTNGLIRTGATTGNYITIDGANLRIRSSNYVSGFAGNGFSIDPLLLEVGNIACRGLIRTYCLQKDILSVNAGSLIIAPNADSLDQDMTAAD